MYLQQTRKYFKSQTCLRAFYTSCLNSPVNRSFIFQCISMLMFVYITSHLTIYNHSLMLLRRNFIFNKSVRDKNVSVRKCLTNPSRFCSILFLSYPWLNLKGKRTYIHTYVQQFCSLITIKSNDAKDNYTSCLNAFRPFLMKNLTLYLVVNNLDPCVVSLFH